MLLGSGRRGLLLALLCVVCLPGCDVLRVIFPSSDHDEVAPPLPDDLARPAVLIFSKTNGFRHTEAIEAGLPVFAEIGERRGWNVFATENGAIHQKDLLERFDVVVWFNVSGNVLAEDQRQALLDWIAAGGGFFGVHGTGGDPDYAWAAHPETLVRAQFVGHPMGPQFQEATIEVEAPTHPTMKHLAEAWTRTEEWYSFEASPRGEDVQVLATLDETTYSPVMKIAFFKRDLRMGEDHPIIWTHCIGRGRSLYSALGHQAAAYAEPEHVTFLEESVAWLATRPAAGCEIPGP